jgi:DNA-binding GntR family transcriptional regulator
MFLEGTKTLAEQIFNHLTQKIIDGDLLPGERVFEAKLAKEMGVSRSPVREAFRMLEKSRLVEVLPHKGARVTELSTSSISRFMEVHEALLVLMARKAVLVGTEKDLLKLRKIIDTMKSCVDACDSQTYFMYMNELIGEAQKISKNPLLDDVMTDFGPSLTRILRASNLVRSEQLIECFQKTNNLVCAIEKRDLKSADKAIRDYVAWEKDLGLKFLGARKCVGS